jgi:hypothetical protein
MCGVILEFLPIKVKIRLESVSKQFQRCIIWRQSFEISDSVNSVNNSADSILKEQDLSGLHRFIMYHANWENLNKVLLKFKFINEVKLLKRN